MPPRKSSLPLFNDRVASPDERPALEQARRRLGGPGETNALAGTLMSVPVGGGRELGVALFVDDDSVDVWLDGSRVRRARLDQVERPDDVAAPWLDPVVADVKLFATLRGGEPVRWLRDDGEAELGLLVEKCRYGGIVAAEDGRVLAIGFRRLWPVPVGSD